MGFEPSDPCQSLTMRVCDIVAKQRLLLNIYSCMSTTFLDHPIIISLSSHLKVQKPPTYVMEFVTAGMCLGH
jgi:hypothetical protein